LALGLAVLSYRFVENPIRRSTFLIERQWATPLGAGLLIGSCFALTYAF
jgi:peptidoglycan/LPS O-acetylase OafA/YrhL